MCGIGAILDPAGTAAADAGRRMTAALRHRGPDGDGVDRSARPRSSTRAWRSSTSAGGDQPLHSEDGACSVVVNGEIYNHLELRAELEAHGPHVRDPLRLRGRSSTPTRSTGADCVRHLNGMFAFALWDGRERRLVAARDPFGVKPLYWWTRRPPGGARVRDRRPARRRAWSSRGSTARRSTTTSPAASCRARARCSRAISKLPPAVAPRRARGRPAAVSSYREAPGEPFADAERRRARRRARRPLHRRGRAPDDVRRPVRRVPLRRRRLGRDRGGDGAARPTQPPDAPSRSASPATATCSTSATTRPSRRALIGTDHHDTAHGAGRLPRRAGRCVRHLEEPCGIPSAPALMQLSRFAAQDVKVVLSGQGADEPHGGYGRHQAAAALGAGAPGSGRSRRRCARRAGLAPRQRARAPRRAAARATCPTPSASCGWSRSPTRTSAHGLVGGRRRGRRRRAASRSPRTCSATSRDRGARRAGALPRHAPLPPRRPADLRRQDVDVGEPRAARAVPRRRADAVRRADPGRARACARARASASTAGRWRGCCPPELGEPAQARLLDPLRHVAAGVARRGGRSAATRPAARSAGWSTRARSARLVAAHRGGPRRPQAHPLLPARAVRVAPRVRRGRRARSRPRPRSERGKPRLLYVHSRKASFVEIDREILAERYEVEDWYQPGRVPNLFRLVPAVIRADLVFGWFASWHTLLPDHARLAAAQAVGADRRRLRHGEHARHRLRLPAGRPAALGEPLDHEARRPAGDELELQPQRDRGQHADPAGAGHRDPPRRARPVRPARPGDARASRWR